MKDRVCYVCEPWAQKVPGVLKVPTAHYASALLWHRHAALAIVCNPMLRAYVYGLG